MLSAKQLPRLVAFTVLMSMGILLASLGLRNEALTAPLLFYLIVSVLTTCAFFMLTGMTERTRMTGAPSTQADDGQPDETSPLAYGIKKFSVYELSDDAGVAIPAVIAFLGMMFVCCVVLVSGLPPLSGFVAKFSLLATMLKPGAGEDMTSAWILSATIVFSGLVSLIALSRVGMQLFWSVAARATPRLRLLEAAPVATLVLLCLALTVAAGPVTRYLDSAASSLHRPDTYIDTVLSQETRREQRGAPR
jgi:multicomponent K+:H+ antiporter subunit D